VQVKEAKKEKTWTARSIYRYHLKAHSADQEKQAEEQAEERRAKSRRQAKLYACAAIVQLALDVDNNATKHYHFAPVHEHCEPNGYLKCKVPCNYALNPDPRDTDFASMEGDGVVTMILFDIMDDAVAFRHFRGRWFTVGVERGVLERVEITRALGTQLDVLCKERG
jgi:hypothetical protein